MRPVVLSFEAMLETLRSVASQQHSHISQEMKFVDPADCDAVARFIEENDLNLIALGRHDISDAGVYALIQEYDTKATGLFEIHRRNIDLQYVISGREKISYISRDYDKHTVIQYDNMNDIEFVNPNGGWITDVFDSSKSIMIYPGTAHKPCISVGDRPEMVRKIVVKIPYRK